MNRQNPESQTHRRWAFTLQLDLQCSSQSCVDRMLESSTSIATPTRKIQYLLLQVERASTGQLHAQGAVALSAGTRLATMKRWNNSAHWEPARDWQALLKYCRKAESQVHPPAEWGKDLKQGTRSDLQLAVSMIQSGSSMAQVASEAPLETVKFFKGLIYLQGQLQKPEEVEKKVAIFWGPTGTGKTRLAFEAYGEELYTVFDNKSPWYDGYTGQRYVLFDECGGGDIMHYNKLKRVLDRYPMQVPIKGGAVWWKPTHIILTANTPLEEWYPGMGTEHLQALRRRVRQFEFPQDKELATAWIYNRLIEPAPKRTQLLPATASQLSEGCKAYLDEQDEFQLFRD